MAINVACEKCDWKTTVKDDRAGKRGKCPTCGEPIVVPTPRADPEDVEAAAAAALLDGDDDSSPPPPPIYAPSALSQEPVPVSRNTVSDKPAARSPKSPAARMEYRVKERVHERRGITISGGVIVGLLMMAGAALWFFIGMAANRIYIYPPILFIIGLVNLVRGLMGHEPD